MRRSYTRAQKMVIIQGILCFVLVIDIIQLWLITATMNSYLGGDSGVPIPAFIGSALCLLLNLGLLKFVYNLDRVPSTPTETPHQ